MINLTNNKKVVKIKEDIDEFIKYNEYNEILNFVINISEPKLLLQNNEKVLENIVIEQPEPEPKPEPKPEPEPEQNNALETSNLEANIQNVTPENQTIPNKETTQKIYLPKKIYTNLKLNQRYIFVNKEVNSPNKQITYNMVNKENIEKKIERLMRILNKLK